MAMITKKGKLCLNEQEQIFKNALDINKLKLLIKNLEKDIKDIVGTKEELDNYDTSTLVVNDILKVLKDETQNNAQSYYRWLGTEDGFNLIGTLGAYYTKQEIFDTIRPVNSTYVQYTENDNPNDLFNNANITSTWVEITEHATEDNDAIEKYWKRTA